MLLKKHIFQMYAFSQNFHLVIYHLVLNYKCMCIFNTHKDFNIFSLIILMGGKI